MINPGRRIENRRLIAKLVRELKMARTALEVKPSYIFGDRMTSSKVIGRITEVLKLVEKDK